MLEGSDHHAPIRNQAVIRRLSAHYPTPKQAGLKPDNEFVQLVGLGWGSDVQDDRARGALKA